MAKSCRKSAKIISITSYVALWSLARQLIVTRTDGINVRVISVVYEANSKPNCTYYQIVTLPWTKEDTRGGTIVF